jgi:hypothetical protein
MAEGDDPPREPPKDFDRMSLNSLKREMEVQKSKTEMAREEVRERQRAEEQKKGKFPWAMVLGIVVVGTGAFFGIVYALRATMPRFADVVLPDFMYVAPDAGPPPVDAWTAPDAGDDAYVAPVHHAHPHPSGTGTGGAPPPTDDLGLGDLGHDGDPIGGVR